jgi:hypothetical protein
MSEGQEIRFDDGKQPAFSHGGGVYNLRDRSRTGTGSIRGQSLNRTTSKEQDLESVNGDVEDRDIHRKQVSSRTRRPSLPLLIHYRFSRDGGSPGMRSHIVPSIISDDLLIGSRIRPPA